MAGNPNLTNVTVTMNAKHLVLSVSGLILGVFAVGAFLLTLVFNSLDNRVASLDETLKQMQESRVTDAKAAHDAETTLRTLISDLNATLKVTTTELSQLNSTVAGLDESIEAIQVDMAAAAKQRQAFESWVFIRLGAEPTSYPTSWGLLDKTLIDKITLGADPVEVWSADLKGE